MHWRVKAMVDELYDVAVVGIGPVGAVLANLLGQSGLRTLAIDRELDMFPLPRAMAFDHEIMRTFQNIGVAAEIVPHIAPYRPTEYRGKDGELISWFESQPAPYPLGWAPNYVFTQPAVEAVLRRQLQAHGVEVRLGLKLTGLVQGDDCVELDLVSQDGRQEQARARYVVACDGGSSTVREQMLGVRFESLDFDEPWLVVDVLVNEDKLDKLPENIIQFCDPRRPMSYVVGPNNHRRWEIMLLPGERPEDMREEERIWELLSPWLTPADGRLWRSATYVFHALIAEQWRVGRVLLAGDAAHMTPPFMAQGMCQGLRDAANLAWKLQRVLQNGAPDSLLDSYQVERVPHVRATTATAKTLGRVICELDPAKAEARDAELRAEYGNPPRVRYRQDLIPGLSDGLIMTTQLPVAGSLFPQPRVSAAHGSRLLDDVAGTGFRLVLKNDVALDGAVLELARKHAVRQIVLAEATAVDGEVVEIREADDILRAWFDRHGCIAALVRPDHYVFGTAASADEIGPLLTALDERLSDSRVARVA